MSDVCKNCKRKCTDNCQFHPDYWKESARNNAIFLLDMFEKAPCDCEAVSHCIRCKVVAQSKWMLDLLSKPTDKEVR